MSPDNQRVRVVAVVPARMASSRFPGKPLVEIAGLPMVEHVRRRAHLARSVDEVIVATCDLEVVEAVERRGGIGVMTADTHDRCTTRVAEAMEGRAGEIVIIAQGDEPLLIPEVLDRVAAPLLERQDLMCINLLSPLARKADLANPDIVKAVLNQHGFVMFLSRSSIPSFRQDVPCPVYRQTGIMALRADYLREYIRLPETPFERAESIDMLRVLEHGHHIFGVVADQPTLGVDRPGDVGPIEEAIRNDSVQAALHTLVMNAADFRTS